MTIKNAIFWVVPPHSLVDVKETFCRMGLQGQRVSQATQLTPGLRSTAGICTLISLTCQPLTGHIMDFRYISILFGKSRHIHHIIRQAIGIELHSRNMNRQDSFCLSKPRKHFICSQSKCTKPLLKNFL
jgi:hypothetical protein